MIIRYVVKNKEDGKYYGGYGIYGRIFSEDINDAELFWQKKDAQEKCYRCDDAVERLVLVVVRDYDLLKLRMIISNITD